MRRVLTWLVVAGVGLGAALYASFQLSPWPSVLLIRHEFDKGAVAAAEALGRHVPPGIVSTMDIRYAAGDPDALLDLFKPGDATEPLPVVVWVHGGAFVYGRRDNVTNYLKVLASRGFATVAVGYSKAPSANYPTPLAQVNAALGYLSANADRLGLDPERIVLAGDSAGAQIAAQLSIILTSPDYAKRVGITPAIAATQLKGAILHCGPYGVAGMDFNGPFGGFLRTVLWSYFGTRAFLDDPRFQDFIVTANITKEFPPFFISVGNADPLAPLSYGLKQRADELGIANDACSSRPIMRRRCRMSISSISTARQASWPWSAA